MAVKPCEVINTNDTALAPVGSILIKKNRFTLSKKEKRKKKHRYEIGMEIRGIALQ